MKLANSLALALAVAAVGTSTSAAQNDPHQGHHPAVAATAPVAAPIPSALPGKPDHDMAHMDRHMKSMREMHSKMMAAKTPEARKALTAEHMKAMQDGMDMMNGMSHGGVGDTTGDMAAHHQMMEKRMEMMQIMMQMMMDCMPSASTKQ